MGKKIIVPVDTTGENKRQVLQLITQGTRAEWWEGDEQQVNVLQSSGLGDHLSQTRSSYILLCFPSLIANKRGKNNKHGTTLKSPKAAYKTQ